MEMHHGLFDTMHYTMDGALDCLAAKSLFPSLLLTNNGSRKRLVDGNLPPSSYLVDKDRSAVGIQQAGLLTRL